jgi:hypothetical protein
LAVSSAVWVSFVGPRRSGLADQCTLSASFAFLQSLAQLDLADQPQPVSSSLGLSFPTAHQGSEVHLPRGLPRHPLRSARRVWLPSRRLTPSEPVPVLFRTGGALGIRPSELSPPERYPPRFRAEGPTCRLTQSVIPPPKRWAGPMGRGFWALTLPGVPGGRRMVSTSPAGCSLGLYPSEANRRRSGPGFRPGSSHALRRRRPCGRQRPAPRSLDQPSPGPARSNRQAG